MRARAMTAEERGMDGSEGLKVTAYVLPSLTQEQAALVESPELFNKTLPAVVVIAVVLRAR